MKRFTLLLGVSLLGLSLAACTTPQSSQQHSQNMSHAEKAVYTVTEKRIALPNGQALYGKLYQADTHKSPLIIFSHGIGGNHEILENFAQALAEKGINGYLFDYRGGLHSKSSGKTTDMTVLTEVADLENVLNAVKSWDFVDTDKIILVGESQGGVVAALTAAKHADDIAGLATFYPAYALQDDARRVYPDINAIPQTTHYLGGLIDLGRQYFLDAYNLNPLDKIGAYKKPVLLMHGTKDPIVSIDYSRQARQKYAQVSYFEIDGAPHSFKDEPYFSQALNHLERYLKQNGLDQ